MLQGRFLCTPLADVHIPTVLVDSRRVSGTSQQPRNTRGHLCNTERGDTTRPRSQCEGPLHITEFPLTMTGWWREGGGAKVVLNGGLPMRQTGDA